MDLFSSGMARRAKSLSSKQSIVSRSACVLKLADRLTAAAVAVAEADAVVRERAASLSLRLSGDIVPSHSQPVDLVQVGVAAAQQALGFLSGGILVVVVAVASASHVHAGGLSALPRGDESGQVGQKRERRG